MFPGRKPIGLQLLPLTFMLALYKFGSFLKKRRYLLYRELIHSVRFPGRQTVSTWHFRVICQQLRFGIPLPLVRSAIIPTRPSVLWALLASNGLPQEDFSHALPTMAQLTCGKH